MFNQANIRLVVSSIFTDEIITINLKYMNIINHMSNFLFSYLSIGS